MDWRSALQGTFSMVSEKLLCFFKSPSAIR